MIKPPIFWQNTGRQNLPADVKARLDEILKSAEERVNKIKRQFPRIRVIK